MDKRYDHVASEEHIRSLWEEEGTFKAINNTGERYSIDTPPPTVSGSLHIGHIFSYTHTDIIARYKRMNGFSVVYPFGFDNNGLATERFVEKKLNIRAVDFDRSEFIRICLEESKKAVEGFKELWQRMGLSVDWDLQYSTISKEVRRISQAGFIDLYNKGYAYRKYEPAIFCPVCRTSVAQAELDDKESESFFNDIVFTGEDGNQLVIATTRPELLPSCVALFYNPADERYKKLKGKTAHVPLFDIEVPILEDELVDMEKGSGLVMSCTFGDTTDITWYKKHNLPYRQSIGANGKMTELAGFMSGLSVKEARKKIIQELLEKKLLIRQQPIKHMVNIHERCKHEIEFLALPQWFITILDHKKTFLDQADKIEWFPTFMKARYKDWVEHLGWDWCISRQRFYGIPFPVWHCLDCDAIILADPQDLPVDPQEAPYKGNCPSCSGTNIAPDTDVMDTWNSSSLTPYICAELIEPYKGVPFFAQDAQKVAETILPMNMRPQAHDIIRTWAFYTIVKAWMHNRIVPWNSVVISGHVLAGTKGKISKSKGGSAITPEHLLKTYSADAIRYWTASASLGYDVAFSEEQIKVGQRLVTKMWNAFRFVKEHLILCDPDNVPENLGPVNEWLLDKATICFEQYHSYLEQNEFSIALDNLEKFFWHDFCDNYLEIIKDQLFNPELYESDHLCATKWTLYVVGLRILQLYAPYIPYITEAIYQLMFKEHVGVSSLHKTRYAAIQREFVFKEGVKTTDILIEIIAKVRKLKSEHQLSLKTELTQLTVYCGNIDQCERLKSVEQILKGVSKAQKIEYVTESSDAYALEQKDDQWHAKVSC